MCKNTRKIILFVLLISIFASCNLERMPHDKLATDVSLETMRDARNFREGFYERLRNEFTADDFLFDDMMSDLLHMVRGAQNLGPEFYTWNLQSAVFHLPIPWANAYSTIQNVNFFLSDVDKLKVASAKEEQELKQYKAEARLIRAMSYHHLLQRYAKAYSPESSTSDLGVPIVKTRLPSEKKRRATVEECYRYILDDALATLGDLSNSKTELEYLNVYSAYAFLSRVYLHMQQWDEASKMADKLLPEYPLVNTEAKYREIWSTDSGDEIITQLHLSPNELSGSKSFYQSYSLLSFVNQPALIPEQWVIDLYEADDIRKKVFFKEDSILVLDKKYLATLIDKYPGNPAFFTKPPYSNYYNKPKLFRVAELYLIKAEAALELNNLSLATKCLNDLRRARGISELAILSREVLRERLEEERIRELLCEGVRLSDLKRWQRGFERGAAQNAAWVDMAANMGSLKIEADNKYFLWEIPSNDLQINKDLLPNWK